MTTKRWMLALPGLLLVAAFTHNAGGWAVVSVQDLPDYAVAGRQLPLTYTVRQHGENLLGNLKGSVTARSGSASIRVDARPGAKTGYYVANLTLPNAGEWTIAIESGFRGKAKGSLLPLRAIAASDQPPPALAPDERGRRLFVAKGCVTCHTHSDSKSEIGDEAPELTGRKFAPGYLADYLANPSIKPSAQKSGWQMPNPHLEQQEIAALVAFINSERRVVVK